MPLRDVDLSRLNIRNEWNVPWIRTGLRPISNATGIRGRWSGWGAMEEEEPQNLWQRITPWHEEEGQTFGSQVLQPLMQGVQGAFRTVGTPIAAPFLRAQMTPEEKKQMDIEWQENPWQALFGSEGAMSKKYEEMPWWAKLLAESPSFLVGAGAAGAGIKAIAGSTLSRLATQTGVKGAAARLASAALVNVGGPARGVFTQAGKAGGISGRLAQAISAPAAGAEVATGAISKGLLTMLTPTERQILSRMKISSTLTDTQKVLTVKLKEILDKMPSLRKATETMRSPERAARVAKMAAAQQRVGGEEALYASLKQLKGKYPIAEVPESLRVNFTKDEIDDGFNAIWKAEFDAPKEHLPFLREDTAVGFVKLINGELPQPKEIQLIGKVFGESLAKSILDKRSAGAKAWEMMVQVANLPRAVLSSTDISGLLRQGGILTARSPMDTAKSVKPMLKAMLSDKNAKIADGLIRSEKDIAENLTMFNGQSLNLTSPMSEITPVSELEEAFMSNLAEKIPFLGGIVKASNKAYTTALNYIRVGNYKRVLNSWRKLGLQEESVLRKDLQQQGLSPQKINTQIADIIKNDRMSIITDADKRELGRFIMNATGRAPLPKGWQGASELLSTMLFSPKLILSRAQLPKYLISTTPRVRAEAWKTFVAFNGAVTGILAAAGLSGAAQIELDPTSSDFGKIRVGDTRLDLWSGYQQYMRFISTLAVEERKTQAGEIVPANRWDTILRFVESKASPAAGLIKDVMKGETYLGEEMTAESGFLAEQAYKRIAPLAVQDLVDAIEQEGPIGGVLGSPSFLGIGVMSYPPPSEEQLYEAERNMAYQEIENEIWRTVPGGKEIYEKSEEYKKTDPYKARRYLAQYPAIIRAIKQIELEKQRWLSLNKRRIQPLGFARQGGGIYGRANRSTRRIS